MYLRPFEEIDMKIFILLFLLSPALAAKQETDPTMILQTLWKIEDQLLQLINEKGQENPGKNVLEELPIEQKISAILTLWKTKYLVDAALDIFHKNRPYQYPYSIY